MSGFLLSVYRPFPFSHFNHLHIEARKKPSYVPLNPGCLMTGSIFHGLLNNPHIAG